MSIPGGALPPDPALDRLLAEAFQRIRLERFEEAAEKIAEAKALAAEHPAVLEIEGDLAFARRRYREAEALYRQAHVLDPANAKIEEKFATAVLKLHEPELLSHAIPDDDDVPFILGNRKARPAYLSAVFSILFPGAGQMYNGDTVKGWALFFTGIYMWSTFAQSWHHLRVDGLPISLGGIIGGMFHGWNALFSILFTLAWLYGIADAYLIAHTLTEEQQQRAASERMEVVMARRSKK
jgi:tetratricopeptide (TPR) repeat protein